MPRRLRPDAEQSSFGVLSTNVSLSSRTSQLLMYVSRRRKCPNWQGPSLQVDTLAGEIVPSVSHRRRNKYDDPDCLKRKAKHNQKLDGSYGYNIHACDARNRYRDNRFLHPYYTCPALPCHSPDLPIRDAQRVVLDCLSPDPQYQLGMPAK